MSKPISVPTVYAGLSGPLPLSTLDVNFSTLGNAINDIGTYSNYFADTGVVNAMVVTTTPLTWTNADGNWLAVKIGITNTTNAVTLNVNGLGALPVYTRHHALVGAGKVVPGQLQAGTTVILMVENSGANYMIHSDLPAYSAFTTGAVSLTGSDFSVAPTNNSITSRITGGNVMLYQAANSDYTGTSSTNTLSITGLPTDISLSNGTQTLAYVPTFVINNGQVVSAIALLTLGGITFLMNSGSGFVTTGFTASGTKGLPRNWSLQYVLS